MLSQEISAQKQYVCKDGPPKGINPSNCCQKAKSFDETIMKNCFSQYGNIPAREGKGLQGMLNGLEVSCLIATLDVKTNLNFHYILSVFLNVF